MWVYWAKDSALHMKLSLIKERYGAIDVVGTYHPDYPYIGYSLESNTFYGLTLNAISHVGIEVTTLKEIDEMRLMYSLGLTEKDM